MSDAVISPSVGIAGHGGMPGMPPLPASSGNQGMVGDDGGDKEPSPPTRSDGLVDEVYHEVGDANDIIFVKSANGKLSVCDFNVMFSRKVKANGGKANAPGTLLTVKKAVHVYVNEKPQPQLYMRVREDGFCTFPDGRLRPPEEALAGGVGLKPGVNEIRFEIRFLRDARVLVAKCFAFLWGVQTPVIVMDIDGTITRSDVPGLLTTLSLGIYDHTHSGICGLLTRIVKEGAQVMYLTSRPISLASKTRAFLDFTEQDGLKLPLGPLQCCLEKVERVIWRELVSKNMHEFKMAALQSLVLLFREAGKTFGETVFAAGIGNKFTDAVAYRAAGIPPEFIFLIDTSSNLQVWDGDSSKLGGSSSGKPISPSTLPNPQPESESTQSSSPQNKEGKGGKSRRWFSRRDNNGVCVSTSESVGAATSGSTDADEPQTQFTSFTPVATAANTAPVTPAPAIRWAEAPAAVATEKGAPGTEVATAPEDHGAATSPRSAALRISSADAASKMIHLRSRARSRSSSRSPRQGRASFRTTMKEGNQSTEGEQQLQKQQPLPQTEGEEKEEKMGAKEEGKQISLGYDTYSDERFFARLQASIGVARGEAVKAVEAGIHAAEKAAATASCSGRGVRTRESGEHAELRLAERVHDMAVGADADDGGVGEEERLRREELARKNAAEAFALSELDDTPNSE